MISEKPLCYPTLGAPQFCLKPPLATGEDKNWKRGLEERIGRDRKWELRKATEPPNPPREVLAGSLRPCASPGLGAKVGMEGVTSSTSPVSVSSFVNWG